MKQKKLFIFDVDGTLVDAYAAIEKSLNFTRRRFGYKPIAMTTVKKNVGRGDRLFVGLFFPEPQLDRAVTIYRRHHQKALLRFSKLYPRTRKFLSELRRRGKAIAVASNRPAFYTNALLKRLDIRKYFDVVMCADEINSLKPDPKMLQVIMKRCGVRRQETVYVGDMDIDMEAARRARIEAVFKQGGSSTAREVKKYKKLAVSRLEEILDLYR